MKNFIIYVAIFTFGMVSAYKEGQHSELKWQDIKNANLLKAVIEAHKQTGDALNEEMKMREDCICEK